MPVGSILRLQPVAARTVGYSTTPASSLRKRVLHPTTKMTPGEAAVLTQARRFFALDFFAGLFRAAFFDTVFFDAFFVALFLASLAIWFSSTAVAPGLIVSGLRVLQGRPSYTTWFSSKIRRVC